MHQYFILLFEKKKHLFNIICLIFWGPQQYDPPVRPLVHPATGKIENTHHEYLSISCYSWCCLKALQFGTKIRFWYRIFFFRLWEKTGVQHEVDQYLYILFFITNPEYIFVLHRGNNFCYAIFIRWKSLALRLSDTKGTYQTKKRIFQKKSSECSVSDLTVYL